MPFETFAARLAAALDAAVEINMDDSSIAGFVVGVPDERARHAVLHDRISQLQGRSRNFFSGLVDDAVVAGEVAGDVTAEAISDMVTAITSSLARVSTQVCVERHRAAAGALKRMFDGTLMVTRPPVRGARAAP